MPKKKIDLLQVSNNWDTCPQKFLTLQTRRNEMYRWARFWDDGVDFIRDYFRRPRQRINFETWARIIVRKEEKRIVRKTLRWITEIRDYACISSKTKERWESFLKPFLNSSISALQMARLKERKNILGWDLFPKVSSRSGNRIIDHWAKYWKKNLCCLVINVKSRPDLPEDSFFESWEKQILRNYSTEEIRNMLDKLRKFRKEALVTPEMAEIWNEVVLPFILKSEKALEKALEKCKEREKAKREAAS